MNAATPDLLDPAAIEALRRPVLNDARGLPASVYTDQRFYEAEQRTLFPGTWMSIAFDSDVPNPGDAIPLEVCGLPVILTRDQSGTVRVLHNVCRHRATIVLTEPRTGGSNFKCPYHGWVYGLDGALKATPFWDGTPETSRMPVDAACNGLVPMRAEVWNHVVFVNADDSAPPLLDYLGPMDAELAHLDIAGLEVCHRTEWTFKANWKLVMENWEVYHHVWVHEGVFDRMSDEVNIRTGEPYTEMVADGNALFLRYTNARPTPSPTNGLPPVPRHRDIGRAHSTANAILPNTTVTVSPSSYAPAVYIPLAPGLTLARMAWYVTPEAATSESYAAERDKMLDRWLGPTRIIADRGGIRPQDHQCMEWQQRARNSPVADDVKFSTTWESNVRYFQDWVVQRLGY